MNTNEFRVVLKTADGNLIANRHADKSYYVLPSGEPDCEFIDLTLVRDCRQKGVRLIEYTLHDHFLIGLVDYC